GGNPGGPFRAHLIVTLPRPCKGPPSRQRLLPSRPEAWGRAIQSPWAKAQSVHREAASSSAFVSARPTRLELGPRSLTALRIKILQKAHSAQGGHSRMAHPSRRGGGRAGTLRSSHRRSPVVGCLRSWQRIKGVGREIDVQ